MSNEIELLIRMLNPKCVCLEANSRGISMLDKDQLIATLSATEKQCPLGYHLLVAKYCKDEYSRTFLANYVEAWGKEFALSDIALNALGYVVDIITDTPLPSQLAHLRALRKRYTRRKFSHIKAIQKANQIAQENHLAPNSPEARQLRRAELNELCRSNICPRCRGNGEIGRVQKKECPECRGKGRLVGDIYGLMRSLDCTEAHFKRYIHAAVVDFEQHCYHEMSKAENAIKVRLKREIEN